ncbi:carbonic anhydrase [Peniophora sp. CONT]|nr:carbonic anhydrase [Peniophora sp. CONT]
MAHVHAFSEANKQYAAAYPAESTSLPIPPGRKLAVVTCMDARIDPISALGIKLGDAHVIRNAGGVGQDALRSLVISQRLLGTREIAVFHHTDCGMLTFTSDQLRALVKEQTPAASSSIDTFPTFHEFSDLEAAVKSDVQLLKDSPLILDETVITGWIHEVETGKVRQIV